MLVLIPVFWTLLVFGPVGANNDERYCQDQNHFRHSDTEHNASLLEFEFSTCLLTPGNIGDNLYSKPVSRENSNS